MSVIAELNDITRKYGNITALRNITLKIPRNETLTLIGPNGSGKTTMLKILACIETPSAGSLRLFGELVNERNRDKIRLRTTMVFQKTTLFNASVAKNIAYGLRLRGLAQNEIDARIREVLRIVKLEGYENRSARKLSGGEQQRASLARALALKTELLLLDEPTANLDQRSSSIMEAAMSQIGQEKTTTIVLATHNLLQIRTLSENIALLQNGEITQIGKAQDVLKDTSRLEKFDRIENIFSGNAEITEDGTALIDIGNGIRLEAASKMSEKATVFIRPEDIILTKTRIESSARNTFEGKIIEISDLGALVRLRVDAGKPFVVQITKRSFNEMQVTLFSEVFIVFKASAVQVLS